MIYIDIYLYVDIQHEFIRNPNLNVGSNDRLLFHFLVIIINNSNHEIDEKTYENT